MARGRVEIDIVLAVGPWYAEIATWLERMGWQARSLAHVSPMSAIGLLV